jgi:hypothetical protein
MPSTFLVSVRISFLGNQVPPTKGAQGMVSPSKLAFCHTCILNQPPRRSLGAVEKADYIASIRCLLTSPAKGRAFFPVQTRYDDFVAVHINASGVATYDADGSEYGVDEECLVCVRNTADGSRRVSIRGTGHPLCWSLPAVAQVCELRTHLTV